MQHTNKANSMHPLDRVSEKLGEDIRSHRFRVAVSQLIGFPVELLSEEGQLNTMGPLDMTHCCKIARLDDPGNGLVVLVHYQLERASED